MATGHSIIGRHCSRCDDKILSASSGSCPGCPGAFHVHCLNDGCCPKCGTQVPLETQPADGEIDDILASKRQVDIGRRLFFVVGWVVAACLATLTLFLVTAWDDLGVASGLVLLVPLVIFLLRGTYVGLPGFRRWLTFLLSIGVLVFAATAVTGPRARIFDLSVLMVIILLPTAMVLAFSRRVGAFLQSQSRKLETRNL